MRSQQLPEPCYSCWLVEASMASSHHTKVCTSLRAHSCLHSLSGLLVGFCHQMAPWAAGFLLSVFHLGIVSATMFHLAEYSNELRQEPAAQKAVPVASIAKCGYGERRYCSRQQQ